MTNIIGKMPLCIVINENEAKDGEGNKRESARNGDNDKGDENNDNEPKRRDGVVDNDR